MAWMLDTAYHGAGPSARLLALLAHLAALKAARLQGPLPDGVPRVTGRIEQATLQALGAGRRGTLSAGVQHDLRGCALFERIAVLHTSLWGHSRSASSTSYCQCWQQPGEALFSMSSFHTSHSVHFMRTRSKPHCKGWQQTRDQGWLP